MPGVADQLLLGGRALRALRRLDGTGSMDRARARSCLFTEGAEIEEDEE